MLNKIVSNSHIVSFNLYGLINVIIIEFFHKLAIVVFILLRDQSSLFNYGW